MADDKVTTEHPSYPELQALRDIFTDVCTGTKALRDKSKAYLPAFPKETSDSYAFRCETATLVNYTLKTRDTLCGLVFQKDITFGEDVPTVIQGTETTDGLIENIDNKGNHFNVFARDLFESSFDGSAVILVDAPTAQAADLGEQRQLGIRPYWVAYKASDVINWDYQVNPVSKKTELSLIVLRESKTVRVGQFSRQPQLQYRVFFLNKGRVNWQLWVEVESKKEEKEFTLEQSGFVANQTQIPVAIVGDLCDKPPLMDLTYKNLEHYQTYSDYKSIIHKTCVPLFYSVNLEGDPVAIGGDVWFKCNEGGSIGFAEVSGSSIDKTEKCLENIKQEMAMLGLAMLAEKVQGDTTATEKMLDSIQETSSLQVRATQLKDALELALQFTANYLNEKQGGSIELGCSWAQMALSAQELTALSGLVTEGLMSLESFLWQLQKTGKLPPDVDVEEEMKRIDEEMKANAGVKPVLNAQQNPNEKTGENTPTPTEAIAA